MNETDPLGDLDLLLLRELAGWAGHVRGRIEDLRDGAVGLLVNSDHSINTTHTSTNDCYPYLDIWSVLLKLLDTVTVGGVAVCQQGNVIRCG